MFKEFRDFAMKGNVIDVAVGIIIGAAFGGIVGSLVSDVIMPPIGVLLGKVDFSNLFVVLRQGSIVAGPYSTIAVAKSAGAVTLNYGAFINTIISFTIVSFSMFILIKNMNRLKRKDVAAMPSTKDCPFCASKIAIKAIRCPNCTSEIK